MIQCYLVPMLQYLTIYYSLDSGIVEYSIGKQHFNTFIIRLNIFTII